MQNQKKKKITEYRAVVFDLDGTLYYQQKLRMTMAGRLIGYYSMHPWRVKELVIIKEFRTVREHWEKVRQELPVVLENLNESDSLDEIQYAYVAKKMNETAERVEQVIRRWIYENPLSALRMSKDEEIGQLMNRLRERNIRVIIFSDYPVKDKLEALEMEADGMYSATDERIMELKPAPKGLVLIMQDYGMKPEDILMIGDRFSKDGLAAVNAGVDYLILDKTPQKRHEVYNTLFSEFEDTVNDNK